MDIAQLGKQLGLGLLKQAGVQPKLTLVPGTIIGAKVLSVHPPDLAVLLMGGVQVTAKINQLPTAGEQLSLLVSGQNSSTGQIELQVVQSTDESVQTQVQTPAAQTPIPSEIPTLSQTPSASVSETALQMSWLQTLSKSDRLLATQITEVFDRVSLPATLEVMKPLMAALSGKMPNEQLIKTAILTHSLGLPLEPAVLHALETVLHGPPFGTLFEELNHYSPGLLSTTQDTHTDSVLVSSQAPLPTEVGPQSAHQAPQLDEAAAKLLPQGALPLSAAIPQFPSSIAPMPEAVPLLSQTAEHLSVLQEVFLELNSALTASDSTQAQLLLKQLVATVGLADDARLYRQLLINADTSEIKLTGQATLTRLLLAQITDADQTRAPNQGATVEAASGSPTVLSNLVDHLVGQQLLHGFHSESPFAYTNFALPLFFSQGQSGSAHIHLLGRKTGPGGRQLDPSNCTLFFRLDLPEIGPTDLYVQVIERNVSIRFTVEADVKLPLMSSDLDELKSSLGQFGYRLGNVNTEFRNEAAVEPLFFYLTQMRSRANSIHILA
ncbi:MAG: hypothetical protein JWN30_120 [Bacilli bacterium]|nr:hypothetical protein [Bacilli bacterium]